MTDLDFQRQPTVELLLTRTVLETHVEVVQSLQRQQAV